MAEPVPRAMVEAMRVIEAVHVIEAMCVIEVMEVVEVMEAIRAPPMVSAPVSAPIPVAFVWVRHSASRAVIVSNQCHIAPDGVVSRRGASCKAQRRAAEQRQAGQQNHCAFHHPPLTARRLNDVDRYVDR